MRLIKKTSILLVFALIPLGASAQVLITLLLGDALNSDKVEFGLIGGLNRSYIYNLEDANGLNNFNLGFYFHIQAKGNGYLSTGVLVKSAVGAKGLPTYPIGDPQFDDIYEDGELTKKINYFYVPMQWHQRFNNRWYLEGGIQLGLRNKANDIFTLEAFDGETTYVRDVRDEYKRIDAGVVGGVGYKFKKQPKSMSAGVNYYYGLVNVSNLPTTEIKNSSLLFYLKIPIGSGSKTSEEG